jgi:hypothetical protein
MCGFRVELLHAESLPLHLLDTLKEVFESSDPVVRKAAKFHRDQLAKHCEFISGQDYSRLLTEWDYWIELFKNRHRLRQRLDPNRYLSLGSQIEAYEKTYSLLNERFFSLVAIGLFSAGSSREDVVNFLNEQSWATKHEILTRWGWMKRHAYLLAERKFLLPAPYSCSLTLRGEDGEHDDEEFYHLLSFLHLLRFETGRELLFFEKGETPDFTIEDKNGKLEGAEMTQAWTSPTWTKEHIAATQTLRFIAQQLQHLNVHIHVETPRSWRSLRKRLTEIAKWLVREIVDIGIPTTEISLQNRDLNLKLKLRPAEERPGISHGSAGPKALNTEKQSQAMHASLQRALSRKMQTPEPCIKPCHLVIYPYHDLDTDPERVVAEFFRHPTIDVSSHFFEVWLSSETALVKLA